MLTINFNEKQITYILNAINFTMSNMWDRNLCSIFFDRDNHFEDMEELKFIHRYLSVRANNTFYKTHNEVWFLGQQLQQGVLSMMKNV